MDIIIFVFTILLLSPMLDATSVLGDDAVSTSRAQHKNIANGYVGDADTYSNSQVIDIISFELSTIARRSVRTSPECWLTSITTLSRWDTAAADHDDDDGYGHPKQVHSSGSAYCAAMTPEQQEVLALELTNCQLMKEKRQIYDKNRLDIDTHTHDGCLVGEGSTIPYDSSSCLPLMSDYALSLYHKILLHTNEVCTRLTDETMLLQREEVTQMLVHASSAVSNQMQSILNGAMTTVEKIQLQSTLLDTHSTMISQSISMIEKQSMLLEEQSSIMKVRQEEAEQLHDEREIASVRALETLTNQTAVFLQEHAARMKSETSILIEEQADKIRKQRLDLERMQEVISSANSQMQQPLSSIETYVKMATNGFTIAKSFLHFILWLNISWMVASIPLLHSTKRYLYGVFTLGLLVEVAVVWLGDGAFGTMEAMDGIELVRNWTRMLAIVALLLSSILSCFYPTKKNTQSNNNITMDELLQSQLELVNRFNNESSMENNKQYERRIQVPIHGCSNAIVKFSEERGSSNRKFKPIKRRSRSPYRSSMTGLPVVTPSKPRHPADVAEKSQQAYYYTNQSGGTYYAHRYDGAKEEEDEANNNHLELECLRSLYQKSASSIASSGAEDDSCGSTVTSIESSSPVVPVPVAAKLNKKKRTVTEMYASSGDESQFYSANEEEMSIESDSDASRAHGKKKSKKSKLASVPEEVQIH